MAHFTFDVSFPAMYITHLTYSDTFLGFVVLIRFKNATFRIRFHSISNRNPGTNREFKVARYLFIYLFYLRKGQLFSIQIFDHSAAFDCRDILDAEKGMLEDY